jgi:hypothetical protein
MTTHKAGNAGRAWRSGGGKGTERKRKHLICSVEDWSQSCPHQKGDAAMEHEGKQKKTEAGERHGFKTVRNTKNTNAQTMKRRKQRAKSDGNNDGNRRKSRCGFYVHWKRTRCCANRACACCCCCGEEDGG